MRIKGWIAQLLLAVILVLVFPDNSTIQDLEREMLSIILEYFLGKLFLWVYSFMKGHKAEPE
jgi:hypothetical protein